jgi:phosphoserine aminotransferase
MDFTEEGYDLTTAMISFYPGPSRVYDDVPKYVHEAYASGILSMNHRSPEFMGLMKKTITLLKRKLGIPKAYTILFTASATECWEVVAQSWISDGSFHLYNGAFGRKWYEYTYKLKPGATALPFDRESILDPRQSVFKGRDNVICITQNETSNGTQVSNEIIRGIRTNNPGHLLAVDATSSLAGIKLDFSAADIWLASVQKCFGLPAGLGIMICSPAAITRARMINNTQFYNSAVFMADMMLKWQTPCTPNVLGIYLLMRIMETVQPIGEIHKRIQSRYRDWMNELDKQQNLQHLIQNKAVRSLTVIPLEADERTIARIKKSANAKGFLLGDGYGDLKTTTLRIANFPALKDGEVKRLQKFLATI